MDIQKEYDDAVRRYELEYVDYANSLIYGGPTPPVGPSQFDTVEEDRGER